MRYTWKMPKKNRPVYTRVRNFSKCQHVSSHMITPSNNTQHPGTTNLELISASYYPVLNLVELHLLDLPQFCFFPPAKMREIWRPRENAWLNSSLVWNSETKGNHASTATGTKITIPIRYSYPLDNAFTDPHSPKAFTTGLLAWDICCKDDERIRAS